MKINYQLRQQSNLARNKTETNGGNANESNRSIHNQIQYRINQDAIKRIELDTNSVLDANFSISNSSWRTLSIQSPISAHVPANSGRQTDRQTESNDDVRIGRLITNLCVSLIKKWSATQRKKGDAADNDRIVWQIRYAPDAGSGASNHKTPHIIPHFSTSIEKLSIAND